MPRIKLELPESFPFETELAVRITDINYGGHLGNDSLLVLLHEARSLYFKSMGFTERDVGGCGVIMTDAELLFASEAFDGEILRIAVAAVFEGRTRCELFYRVTEKTGGREVARAKTGMAFFDYTARKIVRAPDGFRNKVQPYGPEAD